MTGCEAYEPLLCAFVDGELSGAEQRRLDAHLRSCETCQASLAGWEAVHQQLASVTEVEIPASVQAAIRGALVEEAARIQCEQARPLLSAFLDGELAPEQRESVSAHLEDCRSCSRQLASLRWTVRVLHALPCVEPPPGLRDRVLARTSRRRPAPAFSLASAGGILAVAALFLMLRPLDNSSDSGSAVMTSGGSGPAVVHQLRPGAQDVAAGHASAPFRTASLGPAVSPLRRGDSSQRAQPNGAPALQQRPVSAENPNGRSSLHPATQIAMLVGPSIPSSVIAGPRDFGPSLLKGPAITAAELHPVSQAPPAGNTGNGYVGKGYTGGETGGTGTTAPVGTQPGVIGAASGPGSKIALAPGPATAIGFNPENGGRAHSGTAGDSTSGAPPVNQASGNDASSTLTSSGGVVSGASGSQGSAADSVRLIVLRPAQEEGLAQGVWSAAQDKRNELVSQEASQVAQAVVKLEKGYAERKKGAFHDISGAPRVGVSYERPVGF